MRSHVASLILGSLLLALTIPCLTGCATMQSHVIDNSVVYLSVSDRPIPAALENAARTHTVYVMADDGGEYADQAREILEDRGISVAWLSGFTTAQVTTDKNTAIDTVFLHVDTNNSDTIKDLASVLDGFSQTGYTYGTWSTKGDTNDDVSSDDSTETAYAGDAEGSETGGTTG